MTIRPRGPDIGRARRSKRGTVTNEQKRQARVLGVALAGLLALPAAAVAEERECVGAIGPETVDNVRVPSGAVCTLNGTLVQGTVKVERDATLQAQGTRVIGNVQAEGAADVAVRNSRVGGSVQVKQDARPRRPDRT